MAANHPRYAQQKERRRAERAEFGGGKRQRQSSRPMSGVELLSTRLFGMAPSKLLPESPPPVSAAPARFSTAAQYYACMQDLVVEEARAVVAEGLLQNERRTYSLEIDAQEPGSAGDGGSPRSKQGSMESVRVRVEQVAENDMPRLRDACRAGGIWLLATTGTGDPGASRGSTGRFGRRGRSHTLAERYLGGDGRLAGIDGREGFSGGYFTLEMPAASAAAVRLAA